MNKKGPGMAYLKKNLFCTKIEKYIFKNKIKLHSEVENLEITGSSGSLISNINVQLKRLQVLLSFTSIHFRLYLSR